jgi:hypothetical protein
MPTTPLPPEKQAEIEGLERAIREAIDTELNELAANLATTDDAHLFGDNEFKIRDLSKFSASLIVDALRVHPAVIIGGIFQENPFYVPPDQFLPEWRERGRDGNASAV